MSDKRYRQDDEGILDAMPALPIGAPGKMPASAKLFPGAMLMRMARDANGVRPGADAAVAQASSSAGSALPDGVRSKFESSLGADLSSVRVHTGAESAAAASAVGARAYTVGNDIHFAAGQFAPADPFGIHLLAHEVAHTQQQAGGTPHRQHKLEVSSPGDAAEGEADRAADAMVSGASFALSSAPLGAYRSGVESEGGANFGTSTKGVHVNFKKGVSKEFPAKWVKVKLGGELAVEGELERKGKGEKAGEKKEGGEGGEGGEGAKKAEEGPPSEADKQEAIQGGGENAKNEAETTLSKDARFGAEWESPEVEVGTGGSGEGGVALNLTIFGKKVPVKGTLLEVKKGHLEGPKVTVEVPFSLGESKIWENERLELKVKKEFTLSAEISPNYEEIAKTAAKQILEKGLDVAEDAAMTALEAMGSVAGIAAMGVAVMGAMVFAGVMDHIETGEVNAAIASGRRQIQQATAAAMDAYGVQACGGNGSVFAMAAYTAAWNQVATAFHSAKSDPKFAKFDFDLNNPDLRAELSKRLASSNSVLEARAHRAAIASVSVGVAQQYYDTHASAGHTDEHVSVEAQKICGTLDRERGGGWTPIKRPDGDFTDKKVRSGEDGVPSKLKDAGDEVFKQASERIAATKKAEADARAQEDADCQNSNQHRDLFPTERKEYVDPAPAAAPSSSANPFAQPADQPQQSLIDGQ